MNSETQYEWEYEYAKSKMQKIARYIEEQLLPDFGFVMLAFPFAGGKMNYVSNCERESVVSAMREFIAKTEGKWAQHIDSESEGNGK